MTRPGIDMVFVNYRSPSDLQRLGASLSRHAPEAFPFSVTIVNVEPGCNDTKIAQQAAAMFDEAKVLEFEDNVGYGYAGNQGGALGDREIVGIFNVDLTFMAGAIDHCCQTLLAHPDWGIAGPRQINGWYQITAAGIFGTNTEPKHRGWMEQDTGAYRDVSDDCIVVVGSAMFIKRSVWDQLTACPSYRRTAPRPNPVGPLLETALYYEDAWLSYHASAHGHRLGYIGDTAINHEYHGAVKIHGDGNNMEAAHDQFRLCCDEHGIAHD